MNTSRVPVILALAASWMAASTTGAGASADHLLVTTSDAASGNIAIVGLSPPWPAVTNLEPVGTTAIARHWRGLHYVVNGTPVDAIHVIDPETWQTVQTLSFGAGSDPNDIIVVDDTKAFVSLRARPFLLVIDPASGAALDSIDLSLFADSDGIPEASRMEQHAGRLFVQIQRSQDMVGSRVSIAPSLLAVIDAAQDTVIDVDPSAPGTQAITLTGLHPVNDMQIDGDRLYVMESGSGEIIDPHGGIDEIDLTTLQALGFVAREIDLGGDTDCFVLVSPTKGYAVTHTDFTLSSHLLPFSRITGTTSPEVFFTVGARTDQLAFDAQTGYLFFPANASGSSGIVVVDVASDSIVTAMPISTGRPPRDVLVVRGLGPTTIRSGSPRPVHLRLYPPQPNPFFASTEIPFDLAAQASVAIEVYDASGRRILSRSAKALPAGGNRLTWDGRDAAGQDVAAGVYVLRIESGSDAHTRKVLLVR